MHARGTLVAEDQEGAQVPVVVLTGGWVGVWGVRHAAGGAERGLPFPQHLEPPAASRDFRAQPSGANHIDFVMKTP